MQTITTAERFEAAGIVLEHIKDGDTVISSTRSGSRAICGLCGDTSQEFATSEQARVAGQLHQCADREPAWDRCHSCGGVCPEGECTSSELYGL